MPAVRQYSDMVREYLEPRLCEAAVVYKHLNNVHNSKWEKVSVLRAEHFKTSQLFVYWTQLTWSVLCRPFCSICKQSKTKQDPVFTRGMSSPASPHVGV
jgi:hypothetical protein